MEKEEQTRKAHALAEKCFLAGDVPAARHWMQSAVRLAPHLPGTPQIIAAYDVHAAAARRARDWYGVLDLKPRRSLTHDDVKKQYRRLCLLVHPDKNPSAAADGAFKLIQAAWDALLAKHPPLGTVVPAAPANQPTPPQQRQQAAPPRTPPESKQRPPPKPKQRPPEPKPKPPPKPKPKPPPKPKQRPPEPKPRPPPKQKPKPKPPPPEPKPRPPPKPQQRPPEPKPRPPPKPQPRPRPRRRPAPQTTPTNSQQETPMQENRCLACGAQSFNGRNNYRCMSCLWSPMDGRREPHDYDDDRRQCISGHYPDEGDYDDDFFDY